MQELTSVNKLNASVRLPLHVTNLRLASCHVERELKEDGLTRIRFKTKAEFDLAASWKKDKRNSLVPCRQDGA